MASVIKLAKAQVTEDCLALVVPGSKHPQQQVARGTVVWLTHEYKTAYYGRLEDNGTPVWLEKKVLQIIQQSRSASIENLAAETPVNNGTVESKSEGLEERDSSFNTVSNGTPQPKSNETSFANKQIGNNSRDLPGPNSWQEEHKIPPGFSARSQTSAKALYFFDPTAQKVPSGLAMQPDDQLTIVAEEGAWYFGKNLRIGFSGIFPKTFVRLLGGAPTFNRKRRKSATPSTSVAAAAAATATSATAFGTSQSRQRRHSVSEGLLSPRSPHTAASETKSPRQQQSLQVNTSDHDPSSPGSTALSPNEGMAGTAEHILSNPAEPSKEALALLEKLRAQFPVTDELSLRILNDLVKHCSRSFALVVLDELQNRERAQKLAIERASLTARQDADKDIQILLDEVDRLNVLVAETTNDSGANGSKQSIEEEKEVITLRKELESKSTQLAACEAKAKELQAKVAALENEEWLRNELAFLNVKSPRSYLK